MTILFFRLFQVGPKQLENASTEVSKTGCHSTGDKRYDGSISPLHGTRTSISIKGAEASLVAVPKDPPACQVLHTPELVKIIVEFFNVAVNAKGKNKKALVALTTVNSHFFHASTDILWASMSSASPFIRLLPSCCTVDSAQCQACLPFFVP